MYKTHFLFYFIISCFIGGAFVSCNDFEDYSTNPQHLLTFSRDTVSFDTVITTLKSPIKELKVFNLNDKPLLISSVQLEKGETSQFNLNVDGFSGSQFQDIEIRANDSIFVIVDVKPNANGEETPILFEDHILFTLNGVTQKVLLEAYGQDVYFWDGVILSADTIINQSKPILISDSLVIEEGVNMEINEGVTFYMGKDAYIHVKGTVKANGTLENPVTFRGKRTDYMLSIPYELVPGQWGGFNFDSDSYGNEFNYVNIRNGRSGMNFEPSDPTRNKIRLKNVVLTNCTNYLIHSVNSKITAENCEFSNSVNSLLTLIGGDYEFVHCTIANCFQSAQDRGWPNSENRTLHLSTIYYPPVKNKEETPEPITYPITKVNFYNSIIWGGRQTYSEIKITIEEDNPDAYIHFLFHNCIIPGEKINKEEFQNCIFVKPVITPAELEKPLYFRLIQRNHPEKEVFYPMFDFGLQKDSPARDAADPAFSEKLPLDLRGNSRLEDSKPDIGAYEYQRSEDEKDDGQP